MKKNILILVVVSIVLSLMAFSYMKSNNNVISRERSPIVHKKTIFDFLDHSVDINSEELVYKIETRFLANIAKSDLDRATSIIDILPEKATRYIDEFHNSKVSLLDDYRETEHRTYSENEMLTKEQIELLQATSETDNIYIRSDYTYKEAGPGEKSSDYLTYFISVVPDQQAVYKNGVEFLVEYLKQGSREVVKVIKKDKLKGGQVRFKIDKQGEVTDVDLLSSSGYESVDQILVKLIKEMPGIWEPAANENGDKVDQALVFFFGVFGC